MLCKILIINFILFITSIKTITLPVWYQAPRFWGEPRLIKDHLYWPEFFIRVGSKDFALDHNGCQTALKDLLPKNESITDFDIEFQYTKNLKKGFFYQIVLPIRLVQSNTIRYLTKGQLGDTLITAGWGMNYQNFKVIDYIDLTLQTGIVAPSGTLRDKNETYLLATGYNGKLGFIANGQISLGILEWLTIGGHAALFNFANIIHPTQIKSYGIYGKADHLINGLSVLVAGVKNKETKNNFTKWEFNSLNVFVEYDFTSLHNPCRPSFGVIFDIAKSGKCIIPTTMTGFYFNLVF